MAGQPGRSGRKPKPTRLKVITGNPGGRPLPEDEPRPAAAVPDPPAGMSRDAHAEWHRVTPLLAELGLLTHLDRSTLVAYCLTWAHLLAAESAGDTATMLRCAAQLRGFCAEFGLSPSARSRMSTPEAPRGKGAERLLSG